MWLGGAAALSVAAGRPVRAEGLELADLKKSGVLRIGVEATYVPFTFRKDGKITGYDLDLATLMCADLGIQPETAKHLLRAINGTVRR